MTDWKRSREFYVAGLGFSVDWTHQFEPNFPVFASLTRDGMSIFLTEHAGDCRVGGAVYFYVDVDALFAEITGRGMKPLEPPEDSPWNTREMLLVDPDGNRLRFGQSLFQTAQTAP
jgi:catechol 2,3-dioxygenase-like lactoylglutathione lyase family enzyme